MNNSQAGEFIKALSAYVFDGRQYDGSDTAVKSAFTLAKVTLDNEKASQEFGKLGGKKSAEISKEKEKNETIVRVLASGVTVGGILKEISNSIEDEPSEKDNLTEKSVAN